MALAHPRTPLEFEPFQTKAVAPDHRLLRVKEGGERLQEQEVGVDESYDRLGNLKEKRGGTKGIGMLQRTYYYSH